MASREINEKMKIINNKTKNLIVNYIMTVINNKNEINQNLNPEDLNIILSSGNGSKKKIFNSLSIVNTKFDPKTYSKKNIEKFSELNNLIDPLEEEGIYPLKDFEEIIFNFVPKLEKGLKFDLNSLEYKQYKESEEIETIDKNFFNEIKGGNIFCIFTSKLNGKRHKFKKIISFIDKVLGNLGEFFKIFKKLIIIFQIGSIEQIEEEYSNLPFELREINDNDDNENYKNIKMMYLIKKEEDENSASDIFYNSDFNKTFYFILNQDNYIIKIKNLYSPEDLVEDIVKKQNNMKINEDINESNEIINKKIDAFYEFFSFLKNIKEVKYYFYLSYNFNLILKYNQIEDKLLIKDIFFTRFNGEFRPEEYKKLKNWSSIFMPEYEELRELETIDIDIDFTDMTCINCSQKIKDNEELFYCYICKTKYCFKCVKENYQKSSGKQKFIDPKHNLIFFKTRDKKDFCGIDKYKLGNNTFANVQEEDLGRFKSVQCNGCSVQFASSPRYICISCKPGLRRQEGYNDYCQSCIEHMMQNDEKGQNLQKERDNVYNREFNLLNGENCYIFHNHSNHIYLMVALANNNEENPYTDY